MSNMATCRRSGNRLPAHTHRYFWDSDPAQINVSEHAAYVIDRLLEYGDVADLRWLFRRFSHRKIISVLKNSTRLSRFSAGFWAMYFGLASEEVKCLSALTGDQSNE